MVALPGIQQLNDIWSSADGKVWRQEGNAAWSEREQHTAVVFDDTPNNDSDDPKIFLYGGKTGASSYSNEVWSSTNGVDWTKEDVGGSHWTARSNHQAVVKDGNVYVMGGKDGSSLNNEVWKSSDGHNFTQLSASGHWAARHGFAAVTYDNKIYVIAGETASPATLQKDIWSSSDGIDWTDHGDQAFSARKNFAALVFDSGRSSEIWVLGGQLDDAANGGGTTVSNETWHGNFEDFTIKQFEDRKYFDDADQPYTFITYYYDQDRSGTYLSHYKASNSSYSKGATDEVTDADGARFLYCASKTVCYVSDSSGDIHQYKADGDNVNATWTLSKNLSDSYGGDDLTGKEIVHMTSTTKSGDTKYLYALAKSGELYRIPLNDNGDIGANTNFEQIPLGQTPSGVTYDPNEARIKLTDGSNDEIIITGLNEHVLLLKKNQSGKYACCRAGLD